eukprot:354458-Chlamydomonas_euryale.AAC.5
MGPHTPALTSHTQPRPAPATSPPHTYNRARTHTDATPPPCVTHRLAFIRACARPAAATSHAHTRHAPSRPRLRASRPLRPNLSTIAPS